MDWKLFAQYTAPVVTLALGALLNHLLERRPKLISYLGHASAVSIKPPAGESFSVHTHSIVVRNGGRKHAANVRLGHAFLPNFSVYPTVDYEVRDLPAGGKEILFPKLVPGEQVTVTYLYYAPDFWANVNTYTKSDDGFAKIVHVLPTPQAPTWLRRVLSTLIVVGAATMVYALAELIIFIAAQ